MISDQMRLGTCGGVEREKGKSPNSLVREILAMLIACVTKTYKILIHHKR